jgi:hypothetical protein
VRHNSVYLLVIDLTTLCTVANATCGENKTPEKYRTIPQESGFSCISNNHLYISLDRNPSRYSMYYVRNLQGYVCVVQEIYCLMWVPFNMNSSMEIPVMVSGNAWKPSHAISRSSFESNRTDGSEVPDLP